MYKYIIITPVRNEEAYIEKTIESVANQTIKPLEWLIINDGSTDSTGQIIDNYSGQYKWITAVHRGDRGYRKAGGGVIEAFYDGYEKVKENDWDFIVKLDGDLSFGADYFEKCFREFSGDPKLGIGGGVIFHQVNGNLEEEKTPLYHVRGATKIYRRECWNAIGPLMKAPGWDTLDEIRANMYGWNTQSFPAIQLIHHRYTGNADGAWRTLVKYGYVNYFMGYHPVFMILKCLKRIWQRPYLLGAVGIFYGYVKGYLKRMPQVEDRRVIKYVRQQQLNRLTFKKSIWY